MLDLLFVYGTLRKDVRNSKFRMLAQKANEVTFVGHARVQGRLFHLGGYPGLVLSNDPGAWVRGEVSSLADPNETLSRLDDYEGQEFERVETDVVLDSGLQDKAWVYIYKGSIAGRQEIASGDYSEDALEG